MYYFLPFFLLLPNLCNAQSEIRGLGNYLIEITTPGSLQQESFEEDEPSYVKGTIALPCTHIRTFKTRAMTMNDIPVSNLSLAFYDNKLFKIICDYSPELRDALIKAHGKGVIKSATSLSLCDGNKKLQLWGETWLHHNHIAYVVHAKGYDTNCEIRENAQLVIASKQFLLLASDCELKNTSLFVEEFEKMLTNAVK